MFILEKLHFLSCLSEKKIIIKDLSADFIKDQQILLSRDIQIEIVFWCIISYPLTFFESLRILLLNMVRALVMSIKTVTLDIFEIKAF